MHRGEVTCPSHVARKSEKVEYEARQARTLENTWQVAALLRFPCFKKDS